MSCVNDFENVRKDKIFQAWAPFEPDMTLNYVTLT